VSVSLTNLAPPLIRRSRNSRKFSMIPLCTTATRSVAWGCALLSVGLPGMANACVAGKRLRGEPRFEGAQLALGAPPPQTAAVERRHPGGIIAAVFEAPQRIDKFAGNRRGTEYSNDPAHPAGWPPIASDGLTDRAKIQKSRSISACVRRLSWTFSCLRP